MCSSKECGRKRGKYKRGVITLSLKSIYTPKSQYQEAQLKEISILFKSFVPSLYSFADKQIHLYAQYNFQSIALLVLIPAPLPVNMAQGEYNACCVGGQVYSTCTGCAGSLRPSTRGACTMCRGSGMISTPCPRCGTAYSSAVPSSGSGNGSGHAYGGHTGGYGGGNGGARWHSSGRQGYGSTARH